MQRLLTLRGIEPVAETFADLDVVEVPKAKYTTDELVEHAEGAHALFVHSENTFDREFFERVPSVRVVGKPGSGIDNIDIEAATDHGVTVTHTPGMNAMAVGEYTVGMTIALQRNITTGEDHVRDGGWRSKAWWGTELVDKTVGVVGLGAAGSETAARFRPFCEELVAFDPYVDQERADEVGAELVGFEELLERSHVVSLHVRLNDETRGMIDADALDLMDEDAVLVNTSRGEVVERDALLDALREGAIGGAALDVFHEEPPSPDDELFDLDDVLATPHLAGASTETRLRMLRTTAEAVVDLLDGESIDEDLVANPETLD
ncbi:MAG: hydroxyacid dehydrogenase [Haloferacaceae archaeon]